MSNWQRLVWDQRDAFAEGFQVTLEVCAVSFVFALLGGLLLALVRLYVKPLRPLAIGLIEFFRATPLEVKVHLAELAGELLQFQELPEALEYRQCLAQTTGPVLT